MPFKLIAHDYIPPKLDINILIHGHQCSIFGVKDDQERLNRMGANWPQLDSGCCSMAGYVGFNPAHATLSNAIGE